MITHICEGPKDVYPAVSLCGKKFTREGLIKLPLARKRCVTLLLRRVR